MDKKARTYVEMNGGHVSMQIYLPADVGPVGEDTITTEINRMFSTHYLGSKLGRNSRTELEDMSSAYICLLYLLVRLEIT